MLPREPLEAEQGVVPSPCAVGLERRGEVVRESREPPVAVEDAQREDLVDVHGLRAAPHPHAVERAAEEGVTEPAARGLGDDDSRRVRVAEALEA